LLSSVKREESIDAGALVKKMLYQMGLSFLKNDIPNDLEPQKVDFAVEVNTFNYRKVKISQ